MAYLVLVRHGQSQWNEKGLWTGWKDIPLSSTGIEEARKAGELLKDIHFNYAFTSDLQRAGQTTDEIIKALGQTMPITKDKALNEKDYGDMTGKNKWEVKKEVGDEEFMKIRRSWDYPVPGGESLKMVYERTIPYYQQHILPLLKEGKNVLVSAHNNSLRALVKYLENISDEDISKREMATGEIYIYQIDQDGKVIDKQTRASRPNTA